MRVAPSQLLELLFLFTMDSGNIKVFVRVRPPNEREQLEGLCIEVLTNET